MHHDTLRSNFDKNVNAVDHTHTHTDTHTHTHTHIHTHTAAAAGAKWIHWAENALNARHNYFPLSTWICTAQDLQEYLLAPGCRTVAGSAVQQAAGLPLQKCVY